MSRWPACRRRWCSRPAGTSTCSGSRARPVRVPDPAPTTRGAPMTLWTPDPTFYPSPRDAAAAPPETLAYVAAFDRAARAARTRSPCSTSTPLAVVRAGGRLDRPAVRRRRAAPLRLERVQQRALPVRAAPARRAPLPGRARPALVADLRPRHQGRPAPAAGRQGDRGRGAGQAGRLLPPAHRPLRTGRASTSPRSAARTARRARAASRCSTTPRSRCAGAWEADRGAAVPGVRLLVAHRPRRAGHQRVGHPVDDRGRRGRRAAAGPQVRPRAALLGPAQAPARPDGRPRRPAPDGAGAAARRTTRPRRTASSAW